MGQAAEDLIDGTCDQSGEWNYDIILPREEMSDGDMWRQVKESNRIRKEEKYEKAKELLTRSGIEFKEIGNKTIQVMGYIVWPTTGKFMNKKTRKMGYHTTKLIAILIASNQ